MSIMTFTDADALARALLDACSVLYSQTATNEARRNEYNQAEAAISNTDPQIVLAACVAMLQNGMVAPEAQGFAASTIAGLLRDGRAPANAVPFRELSSHIRDNSPHRVVVSACAAVLALCAEALYPDEWPDMLDTLCPEELASFPCCAITLESVVEALFEPQIGARVSQQRIRALFSAANNAAEPLCRRVVNAIGSMVTHGYEQPADSPTPPTGAVLSALLKVVEMVVGRLTLTQWWTCYVHDLVIAMLQRLASGSEVLQAATIFASLVSAANGGGKSGSSDVWADDETACSFMTGVIHAVPSLAQAGFAEAVELIAESLAQLGKGSLAVRLHATDLVGLSGSVLLQSDSIAIAASGCEILALALPAIAELVREGDTRVAGYNVPSADILRQVWSHARKHMAHPVDGWADNAAVHFDRFGTAEAFEEAFASYRQKAGAVVALLAGLDPEATATFGAALVRDLGAPTPVDKRNQYDHVDQRSPTFVMWEATHFVLANCDAAVADRRAATLVQECYTACFRLQHAVRDATLVPVLLNIMSCLWPSTIHDHWGDTISVLTRFMALEKPPPTAGGGGGGGDRGGGGDHRRQHRLRDPDIDSARKRAASLLVTACNKYGAQLAGFSNAILSSVQGLLIAKSLAPHEVGLVYEAVASLLAHMEPTAGETLLRDLVADNVDRFCENIGSIQSHTDFAQLICNTENSALRRQKNDLRDSLVILTAILRRAPADHRGVNMMASTLLSHYTKLAQYIVELSPYLPPAHAKILDLDPAEKRALANGGNQRPPGGQSPVASSLFGIRTNVYAGIAAMARLGGGALVSGPMAGLVEAMMPLHDQATGQVRLPVPTHLVRQLVIHCLLEAMEVVPLCCTHFLPVIGTFVETHSNVVHPRNSLDEAVETKLVTLLLRSVAHVVKKTILQPGLHQQNEDVFNSLVTYYLSLLHSGYDVKSVYFDVQPLLEDPNQACAQAVFTDLAKVVASPRLSPALRQFVADKVGDHYMKVFPAFSPALAAAGVAPEALDQLHSLISGTSRRDLRRKRFAETLAAAYGIPPFV